MKRLLLYCLCFTLVALATLGLSACRSTKALTTASELVDTTAISTSFAASAASSDAAVRTAFSLDSLFVWYLFGDTPDASLRTTSLPTATLEEDSCGCAATGHPVPVSCLGNLVGNSKSGNSGTDGRGVFKALPGTRGLKIGLYGLKVSKDSTGTAASSSNISTSDSTRFSKKEEVSESRTRSSPSIGTWVTFFGALFLILIGTLAFLRWRRK